MHSNVKRNFKEFPYCVAGATQQAFLPVKCTKQARKSISALDVQLSLWSTIVNCDLEIMGEILPKKNVKFHTKYNNEGICLDNRNVMIFTVQRKKEIIAVDMITD